MRRTNRYPRPALWLLILCCLLAAGCAPRSGGTAGLAPTEPVAATLAPTGGVPSTAPTAAAVPTAAAAPTAVPETQSPAPVWDYRVLNTYPHDPNAFTQGLVYENGLFYEGTGLWGESSLRLVELETGEVLRIHRLPDQYFGEGIAVVGDRIWQLTWREKTAFLYHKDTFEQLDTVDYSTEGWGLTYDGQRLIMSDGTSNLYFRDPDTFELLGQVQVTDEGRPVPRLNELEYVNGQVWANVWQTDRVAIVDPASGLVTAWLDLTGLLDSTGVTEAVDVLNGIAYDAGDDRLFVTGKLWPSLFEIEIILTDAQVFVPLLIRQ